MLTEFDRSPKIFTRNIVNQTLRFVSTHIKGIIFSESHFSWSKSGSFLLPILEQLGGKKTPFDVFTVVNYFSKYLEKTDDILDHSDKLPSFEELTQSTKTEQIALYRSITNAAKINPNKKSYVIGELDFLRTQIYDIFSEKTKWKTNPTYEQAYSFRFNTTGLLSDVVAEIWCVLADVPMEIQDKVRESVQRIGMLLQFSDDLKDIVEDKPADGNMVLAILNEEGETSQIMELIPSKKNGLTTKKFIETAPKSAKRFFTAIDQEIFSLRQISPETSSNITNLLGIFIKNTRIRRT